MEEEIQPQEAETPETPEAEPQAPAKGEDKDWKAEALKFQAIADRKAKQLEKVMAEKPAEPKADYVSRAELEEIRFFDKNPDLEPYRDVLKGLRAEGESFDQVIAKDAIKTLLEAKKEVDTTKKNKSVLETNPRLGQVTDKMSKAREALSSGDYNSAKQNAVSAVLDIL